MDKIEIVRQTIRDFCVEFISHPYLCYTEHGQHALFYTMLYNALPEKQRYTEWQGKKVCVLQKEYPTAHNLGRGKRQHWDIAVLCTPPEPIPNRVKSYDCLKLSAVIEFGLNEAVEHLIDDIARLGHPSANLVQGYVVHLYRLSDAGATFSGRDWSSRSGRRRTVEDINQKVNEIAKRLPIAKTVEIYYGVVDSTNRCPSGLWNIKNGRVFIYSNERKDFIRE
jgi:hypothetical protein